LKEKIPVSSLKRVVEVPTPTGKMTDPNENPEPREPRRENPIFTIWVHTGYAVLILSMIAWMVYMEFFM
jgi:hypothetical protein